jgi:hypothetical protein
MASARTRRELPRATVAWRVGALVTVLVGLILFTPYLAAKRRWRASVAAATAVNSRLFATAPAYIPAHQQACASAVTVTPSSGIAAFQLAATPGTENQSWPLELTLSGPAYRAAASIEVPGGVSGRQDFQIRPPKRALLASACVRNNGHTPVALEETAGAFTNPRSRLAIDGKRAPGELMLTFYERKPRSRLTHLGAVVEHASNLTDRLVPGWLIWLLLALTLIGIPVGIIAALHGSLREDGSGVT